MIVLKLGAVVLALGVGGWLVVNAQRAADRDADLRQQQEVPDEPPETPAGGQGGGETQTVTDPQGSHFLSTSKSAVIVDIMPGQTSGGAQPVDPKVFLPTSKSLVIEDPRTLGWTEDGKPAPDPRGFLPSSKFGLPRTSDILPGNAKPRTETPKPPALKKPAKKDQFIFGSKSGNPLPRGIAPVQDPPKGPDGQD